MSESVYLYKTSCDECGSSDANAIYSSDSSHCFSCGTTKRNQENTTRNEMVEFKPTYFTTPDKIRGINSTTLSKFTYGIDTAKERHVTYYHNAKGEIVAEKYRTRDKGFAWSGDAKQSVLFGQNLWKPNKKISITITEGEIDAMTISQLQNNKYPVVSVPNGANSAKKDVKKQLEWLLGFKEVVLCFDNDRAGQAASEEVASLFPPKFVRIAQLPLKDANDMVKNGRSFELSNALRDAKSYTPDGILNGAAIIDILENEEDAVSFPFPDFLSKTNQMLGGIRMSELMVFTAGTGCGKTTMLKQLQYHYFKETELNQALIHLEEPLKRTAKDLIGISMETRVHLSDSVDKAAYIEKAKEIFNEVDTDGQSRLNLYDSFGSMDSEDLYNKIRFMVKGLDCKVIWLDHLSILVSSLGQIGDERRAIDSIMHELKSLTVELDCFIGLVVHLNNNTQTPFEEGGSITINNLRGSGGIKQLSDSVMALSRNQQAETEAERNTVKVSILKNRYSGETGVSDLVFYNGFTGKFETPDEKFDAVEGF
jgi:twinkle protein